MTKALRMMQENIKLIDIVIELLDARAPLSSRNPEIDNLAKGKARLIVLNKADLADEKATKAFKKYFQDMGYTTAAMDSRNSGTAKTLNEAVRKACAAKIEQNRKKGIINRPMRAMVTGIPNVGKSTLINTLAGKASARTGNRPGVTKGKQWIRLNEQIELLDTPGVLWPKFEDQKIGERLAIIGTINDDILEKRELAAALTDICLKYNREAISLRYGLSDLDKYDLRDSGNADAPCPGNADHTIAIFEIIEEIAKKRGALLKGGEADIDRASALILDDYRSGRLGKITLDRINESFGGSSRQSGGSGRKK